MSTWKKFALAINFWVLLSVGGATVMLMPLNTWPIIYSALFFSFVLIWTFAPIFNLEAEAEKEEKMIESGKRMRVTSIIGDIFTVDVTDEALKPTSFRHGDRLIDPDGRYLTAVGVAPHPFLKGRKTSNVFWGEWDFARGKVYCWHYDCQLPDLKKEGFRLAGEEQFSVSLMVVLSREFSRPKWGEEK
ncbi:MAG: hypothetical protein US81_C0002G0009 [Parcubacteria group bacterium GW2011_GWE2_38_18]|nr:MAG: hypothetical protein US81_C0002G0009 [Parcubacteria group bacterium GW2011_GWE2_38_18]